MTTRQAPEPETAERETAQPETAQPKASEPEAGERGVVVHATDDTFGDVVLASDIPVLVDFWAQWCPPCHMMSPVLDEIAAELTSRLRVVKVDVDENPGVGQRYGILAMPTLSVFRDGKVVSSVVGARPKRRLLADLSEILLPTKCRRVGKWSARQVKALLGDGTLVDGDRGYAPPAAGRLPRSCAERLRPRPNGYRGFGPVSLGCPEFR